MAIRFLLFIPPHGARAFCTFERSPEIEASARALQDAGVSLECEMLRTGEVSLTAEIEDDDDVKVLAHEIVSRGHLVLLAVDRLIRIASDALQEEER